jgi:serine/threonine-protein phosphatase 6 regulatory subunit 3
MFWSLHGGTSAIDTLLASEAGFTLEQLLDEDDLLQECKSQNDKLLDFIVEPGNMSKLIAFVVDMPSETDSEARRFKFPYVASEVLCCDLQTIRDVMLSQAQLMERLVSILQQEPPLAPVLIGYMSKVVVALFKGSPEAFCTFFNSVWADSAPDAPLALPRLMDRLMLHLGSDAVLQMLLVRSRLCDLHRLVRM